MIKLSDYSSIILDSFCILLFPKLFRHDVRMPSSVHTVLAIGYAYKSQIIFVKDNATYPQYSNSYTEGEHNICKDDFDANQLANYIASHWSRL